MLRILLDCKEGFLCILDHLVNTYIMSIQNNPKEKSGCYHLNNKQWTYCNMTEIAAKDDDFTSTCTVMEVLKSTYQSFLLVNPVRVSIIILQRVMNGLDITGSQVVECIVE